MPLAALTIYAAVDNALVNDGALMAVLVLAPRGVYTEGDVPESHPISDPADDNRVGFVSVGGSDESDANLFGTDGAEGDLTIYVRAMSKYAALLIARHIHRVLDGRALPSGIMAADSHALVFGAVALIDDYHDDTGAHNAVLRYTTRTVSTA